MNAIVQHRQSTPMAFSLAPQNFGEMAKFAEMVAHSDFAPKDYKGKPANVMIAIQWGYELGLAPLQALQGISVINGRPAVWGDTALALIRGSAVCQDVEERIEGSGNDAVAICIARRKGAAPVERRFSVADAKAAGLLNKQGPWAQYRDRMLQMRARGFALRDAFPDVLRGVITAEEAGDIPAEPRDITPATARSTMESIAEQPRSLERDGYDAALRGTDYLRTWTDALTKEDRARLKPHIVETLIPLAKQNDPKPEQQDEIDRQLDNAAAAEARGLGDESEPDELTQIIESQLPDLSLVDEGASSDMVEMADGHARWIGDRRTADEVERYFAREDVAKYRREFPLLSQRMVVARDKRLRELRAANGGA